MFQDFSKSVLCACVLHILLTPVAASARDSIWEERFTQAVLQHPEIQAAKAELETSLAQAKIFGAPLYNPELGAELESEGSDTNFRVGVSQTLDWWDRRGVISAQADSLIAEARSRYQQQVLQRYADGLRALAEYEAARRSLEFAQTQETQQRQMLQLIEQRQQAGDLGLVDTELAYLGLVQRKAESAKANAEVIRAEANLGKALPGFTRPVAIPDDLWQTIDSLARQRQSTQWAEQHPAVQATKAGWESRKGKARLTRLEARAEPSLGIGAGRSGDDNVFALTLSLPLHVRNDFSSHIAAANVAVTSAQAQYQAEMRNRLAEIEASLTIMQQYAERHAEWRKMMAGRESRNDELLERLWNNGELTTSEYLSIRQQSSEALAAGLELKSGLDLARIDWLDQSGQALALFNPSTKH